MIIEIAFEYAAYSTPSPFNGPFSNCSTNWSSFVEVGIIAYNLSLGMVAILSFRSFKLSKTVLGGVVFAIGFVGFFVWAHHMFTVRMADITRIYFSCATLVIGVPTAVKIFAWSLALTEINFKDWSFVIVRTLISCFVFGGFTGLILAYAALDLSFVPFDLNSLDDFIFQCKRVKNTDTKIPIILDSCGVVADGYHRIARAILDGKKTIKAYRITNMPKPDKVEDKDGNTVKQWYT